MNGSKKQNEIVSLLRATGRPMTKKELVEAFGHWYYLNQSKHLGELLGRMVNRGLIYRPERGYYALGQTTTSSKQLTLF